MYYYIADGNCSLLPITNHVAAVQRFPETPGFGAESQGIKLSWQNIQTRWKLACDVGCSGLLFSCTDLGTMKWSPLVSSLTLLVVASSLWILLFLCQTEDPISCDRPIKHLLIDLVMWLLVKTGRWTWWPGRSFPLVCSMEVAQC